MKKEYRVVLIFPTNTIKTAHVFNTYTGAFSFGKAAIRKTENGFGFLVYSNKGTAMTLKREDPKS